MREIVVLTDDFLQVDEKGFNHVVARGSCIQINSIMQYLAREYNLYFRVIQMSKKEEECEYGNIHVCSVAADNFFDYKRKIIKMRKYHLLHFNNIDLYDESFDARYITATIHTNAFLNKRNAMLWLNTYKKMFDKIIVVNTEYIKKFCCDNMHLICNGIDTNNFYYEKRNVENNNVLLFPNIAVPNKNLEFALKLICNLNNFSDKKYVLYVLGQNKDNIQEDNVVFLGELSHERDMPCMYRKALVTLIPSLYESCSLCMLESMASGTVVLANNIVGLKDYIADGNTGFLLSVDDCIPWCQKILQLSSDSSLYYRIAVQAYNTICGKYVLKQTAEKYYHIWKDYLI